ncbi:MAG: HD domain-containing protein [Anaerostipes sp.]|jgi:dGTPase|nr:HD domain-containing protein [Anaerostipes sp.]
MSRYHKLSKELQERIIEDRKEQKINPYRTNDRQIIRENPKWDKANLWRPAFVRDVEKIIHSPYYNRYADKTQVFSFLANDDITRRALHVQLVSRIARNIGSILGLNCDLIEAIALGHDIGHTPFGHAGERYLNEKYHEKTGRFFNHNVQSVRVLHGVFPRNISLQVLDGILCHNGEFELKEYRPSVLKDFEQFNQKIEECYVDAAAIKKLIPSTLEGCVVRICDMIAYLGKDRQDARKAKLLQDSSMFTEGEMGIENAEIINNLIVNIVENSYGKDYIQLDQPYYEALKLAKQENYREIYCNEAIDSIYENNVGPMIGEVYEMLLHDLQEKRTDSIIYKHHIEFVEEARSYYLEEHPYREEEENQIVVDYIASMTDDYFVDLYQYLFPDGKYHVDYVSYFEGQ